MNKNKPGAGAPTKKPEEKKVRKNMWLSPEVAARLDSLPEGKRSKLVNNSLALYFAVIDGKVTFDNTQTNPDFDISEILNS